MHSLLSWLTIILSPFSFLNIEAMSVVSSDTKVTKKLSVIPEEMILPRFLKYVRQLIKEAEE